MLQYFVIYIYNFTYVPTLLLLNFEDDLHRLLEHQYELTPARMNARMGPEDVQYTYNTSTNNNGRIPATSS